MGQGGRERGAGAGRGAGRQGVEIINLPCVV